MGTFAVSVQYGITFFFSDSFARKVWEKVHVYTILCLRVKVRFSYTLDFGIGKCSAVATRDKFPTSWFLCVWYVKLKEEKLDRTI